ncbi:CLUMA_CG015903, isoform A [Clunio marinus]|uniref:CLUMA_CG015903, isoform A n=1 Tax=Clunio marinus TaxID=568069 RepID=A0A1J1IVY7_9DIPT|nr:CLUMA_CG015903, isoform A [Clunio marinus]
MMMEYLMQQQHQQRQHQPRHVRQKLFLTTGMLTVKKIILLDMFERSRAQAVVVGIISHITSTTSTQILSTT